jgi:hypothetical protein
LGTLALVMPACGACTTIVTEVPTLREFKTISAISAAGDLTLTTAGLTGLGRERGVFD